MKNQINSTSSFNKAIEVFNTEIDCLINVRNQLNETFQEAVDMIYKTAGRVIVTGVGKSAIIAQKIVATFNSTGTPAIFMHAADAVHGDLGTIQQNDVVLVLSKSGDSAEIRTIIPLLQTMGNKIIALVGQRQSVLAEGADVILWTPIPMEADPNNLAPTASTTAQMVMGDALAISLLSMRGFTAKDFARFHPGGNLGKQLTYRVTDLSKFNKKPHISKEAGISEIILSISEGRLGATAVLEGDIVVGIITDGDLRRMLERSANPESIKAKDIMTAGPKFIELEEPALMAFQLLQQLKITQLIVMDDDRYAGMIHLHDLIKEGFV